MILKGIISTVIFLSFVLFGSLFLAAVLIWGTAKLEKLMRIVDED